jgi:hypothetical protein
MEKQKLDQELNRKLNIIKQIISDLKLESIGIVIATEIIALII